MNIAIINQGGNRYLFEVPESITLKEGEKVKCDTKRGITDGTVWADSITTDEPTSKLIGKLTGANFPLKKVVGKMEYQPFEKSTEDKPEPKYKAGNKVKVINTSKRYTRYVDWFSENELWQLKRRYEKTSQSHLSNGDVLKIVATGRHRIEATDMFAIENDEGVFLIGEAGIEPYTEPEQEPMKLYCVKEHLPGIWLTKGKIYKVTANDKVKMDDGYITEYDSEGLGDTPFDQYFVPLVKRPAKVGEWVLITADSVDGTEKGEICEVIRASHFSADHMYLRTKKPTAYGHRGTTPRTLAAHSEYLVLDGYKPEPEKAEPEYLNMRVVCVRSAGYYHTVGKTYTVVDGFLIDDSGTKAPYLTGPVTSVDDLNSRSACKFAVLLDE